MKRLKTKVSFTIIEDIEKQEKRYYNKYIVEAKYNNKNLKLYIYTKKDIELNYGDKNDQRRMVSAII